MSKQAVEARRKTGSVLAVKTADGRWAYPTFQFTGCAVDPRLLSAIQAFRGASHGRPPCGSSPPTPTSTAPADIPTIPPPGGAG